MNRARYHAEYVAQVKTLFKALTPDDFGTGFVIGIGRDPGVGGRRVASHTLYAYVPVTISLMHGRILLYENTGWLYDTRASDQRHALTWAIRGDLALTRRIAAIGERFGATVGDTEFQAGIRGAIVPDRIQLDLSYGGTWADSGGGAGWTLGVTLISKRIL